MVTIKAGPPRALISAINTKRTFEAGVSGSDTECGAEGSFSLLAEPCEGWRGLGWVTGNGEFRLVVVGYYGFL